MDATLPAVPRPPRRRPPRGIEVRTDALAIGVRSAEGTATLALDGELDAATAPALLDVARSLGGAGCRRLVLDCERLRFCDSQGIRAFVAMGQGPGSPAVRLVRPSPSLRRLLRLAGHETTFG